MVAADLWTGVADEYVQLYAPFFQLFWSRSPSCLNPEHSRSILVPRWTNYFFQRTLRCGIYGQGYKPGGCEEAQSFCRSPKVYSQFSSSCSQQFGKEEIEKIRGYLCDAKVRTVWPDLSICRHFWQFLKDSLPLIVETTFGSHFRFRFLKYPLFKKSFLFGYPKYKQSFLFVSRLSENILFKKKSFLFGYPK